MTPNLIGIDTGGTYTDAVLFRHGEGVITSAKALTTHTDLLIGIREAVEQLLTHAEPASIGLVSISTTLATNAIVENHGHSVCLLLIGQDSRFLKRAKLIQALAGDPVAFVQGGHNAHGDELASLDETAVIEVINRHKDHVQAFAIAGYFSVRNPDHEERTRNLILEQCDLPVTCSHELSVRLDAPRRALTSLLNARLIPLIHNLIDATDRLLLEHNINAPLMIVRGDGALVSAEVARQRPVETILSGPAASVVGAGFLTEEKDVVVSDIGGTTTDIAILKQGRPALAPDGAHVGGWPTMVEAVGLHTFGLGGDSELSLDLQNVLQAGPQRATPLCLFATQIPGILHALETLLNEKAPVEHIAFAYLRNPPSPSARFTSLEKTVIAQLKSGAISLHRLLEDPRLETPLTRLRQRHLVQVAAFTPSDACHVLGLQTTWDDQTALAGARLWTRKLSHACGEDVMDELQFAQQVLDLVCVKSVQALLNTALHESTPLHRQQIGFLSEWLSGRSRSSNSLERKLVEAQLHLNLPIVAVGASAHVFYPTVAKQLATEATIPKHAPVCNAVGAVAGGVFETVSILITAPSEDRYRVHSPDTIRDFETEHGAKEYANTLALELANQRAGQSGAEEIETNITVNDNIVEGFGGHKTFLESRITASAAGRAKIIAD